MSAAAGEAPIYYRIDLDEEGGGDTTEVSDAGLVEQLAAQTRGEATTPAAGDGARTGNTLTRAKSQTDSSCLTARVAVPPPPTPLGPEASAFADRVRYALMFRLGFGPDKVEDVIKYARSLMPRAGARW